MGIYDNAIKQEEQKLKRQEEQLKATQEKIAGLRRLNEEADNAKKPEQPAARRS